MDNQTLTEHIALISDMHLAPLEAGDERAQSGKDRPLRRKAHFEATLEAVRAGKPAAVLFGGDNINQPASRPAYRNLGLTLMQQAPQPWRAIAGNHDVGSCIGWHHHDPDALAEACAAFRATFGSDRWVLEAAGFHIIGLNSQIAGSQLPEAREQDEWLAHELDVATSWPRVVFFHTPLYLNSPDDDFTDGSEQMCLKPAARRPLLRLLEANPPELIITGHAHRFWRSRLPFGEWIGLPATAFGQSEMQGVPDHHLPPGDDRVGWVSLHRDGEGWRVEHHPVVEV